MNLPSEFEQYTRQLFGEALYERFTDGMAAPPLTSVRLNPAKCASWRVAECVAGDSVPWCNDGFYLKERQPFTFDPLLHAGLYYVQEAASMVVKAISESGARNVGGERAVSVRYDAGQNVASRPLRLALDLCAAPGGKSTALRAALPDNWLLMSNEPMRQRAQVLSENLQKWGDANVIVTNSYPKDYRKSGLMFDMILCDVPCSGEGMFRKDEGAIAEWSAQNVENCWRLQREIVADAWECLREGGILIYSTCTFNTKENEENVQWMMEELNASPVSFDRMSDTLAQPEWTEGIVGSLFPNFHAPVLRFIPGVTRSEGLFVAVVRKGDGAAAPAPPERKTDKNRPMRHQEEKAYIDKVLTVDALPVAGDAALYAIPAQWSDIYAQVAKKLNVIHAGVKVGTVKGKDLVPDQSLALSTVLRRGAFPEVEVDYRQAVSYLCKEAVALPPDTPRGFVLLTYKGVPIGFEKNLGNRANNLYPQEWRIKSTHVPEEFIVLEKTHKEADAADKDSLDGLNSL